MKENIKAPRYWPFVRGTTGVRWIPLTKGQPQGKCFHLMTSSRDIVTLNLSTTTQLISVTPFLTPGLNYIMVLEVINFKFNLKCPGYYRTDMYIYIHVYLLWQDMNSLSLSVIYLHKQALYLLTDGNKSSENTESLRGRATCSEIQQICVCWSAH